MSDDPRHLPDDYVLRAGWRLKYEGDEDKYVLTSPIGRQFDIPLARLYSAGYKKVLKYGLEARADLAAPACPKCDGRTEGTMGLKPGYEGVRIYNCKGGETIRSCNAMVIPEQTRIDPEQLRAAVEMRHEKLMVRIGEIISENEDAENRIRANSLPPQTPRRSRVAKALATAPNTPQTPSQTLAAGLNFLGLKTPQSKHNDLREAWQKKMALAFIPPELAGVADVILAAKSGPAPTLAPSAPTLAPSVRARTTSARARAMSASGTPASPPAGPDAGPSSAAGPAAVVAGGKGPVADVVNEGGSGLTRGVKRPRRILSKLVPRVELKKEPEPFQADISLMPKFHTDDLGRVYHMPAPAVWAKQLIKNTKLGWNIAQTKYTIWTRENPIELSDEEDGGRRNKKPRVTTYPLRVVLFVNRTISLSVVPDVSVNGVFFRDLGLIARGSGEMVKSNGLFYLNTVQHRWEPVSEYGKITLARGCHTLIIVSDFAVVEPRFLGDEIFNVLTERLPSECEPADYA